MATKSRREVQSGRLVLRPPAGELEVTELTLAEDWLRLQEGWADPQMRWEYRITWTCDPGVDFHYTEDALANCRYVQFSGRSERALSGQLEVARSRLPCWTPDELVAAVDARRDIPRSSRQSGRHGSSVTGPAVEVRGRPGVRRSRQ